MDLRMSVEAIHDFNFKVLQRRDPGLAHLQGTACFVSVYEFDRDGNAWAKVDVEGTLFLLKRNAEPMYRLLVLNKMSPDEYELDITEETEMEISGTYLMISTAGRGISGFWFYDNQERELMTHQLQKILKELKMTEDAHHPHGGSHHQAIPYVQSNTAGLLAASDDGIHYAFPSFSEVSDSESGFDNQRSGARREVGVQKYGSFGDRERFRMALVRLIQTDDEFLDKIYSAFNDMFV